MPLTRSSGSLLEILELGLEASRARRDGLEPVSEGLGLGVRCGFIGSDVKEWRVHHRHCKTCVDDFGMPLAVVLQSDLLAADARASEVQASLLADYLIQQGWVLRG